MEAVTKGKVSVWSAQRILVPIARAIPSHANSLLKYLTHHTHSTRELSDFFAHYQKSNKTARENMVMHPELFFKAQQSLRADQKAKRLKEGPEGQWRYRLAQMRDQVKHLENLIPQLFYERQDEITRKQLLGPLKRIQIDLNRILITARRPLHDRQDDTSNHSHSLPIGQELPTH